MTKLNYRQIPRALAARQPFEGNSMWAQWVTYTSRTGILPPAEETKLQNALEAADRLYVVYSYGTPIAWAAPGEPLYVPAVKYSATTSRQQTVCRREAAA